MSSIISKEWELLDPCPDIHALFIEFNHKFFWGKLEGVEVKWSPRMTLCAGVCSYEGRGGLCSVRLSAPLLKLRPRKDLIETLLHEMIHAYLFVTANNKDRDGHGPEFQKHMNRINKECGCNITIYHSFHEEVRLYQQHVWRCDGPCQGRKPFFGFVRRSRNSAPSSRDFWWAEHQKTCGGTYKKIQEPEEYTKKKQKEAEKKEKNIKKTSNAGDIRKFINTTGGTAGAGSSKGAVSKPTKSAGGGSLSGPAAATNGAGKVTKAVSGSGISTASNINGFGDFGSSRKGFGGTATANKGGKTLVVTSNRNDKKEETSENTSPSFTPFAGRGSTVGSASSSTGNVLQDRQKFLEKFNKPSASAGSQGRSGSTTLDNKSPFSVRGNSSAPPKTSNAHQDGRKFNEPNVSAGNLNKKLKTEVDSTQTSCPVCNLKCPLSEVNSHLDQCLGSLTTEDNKAPLTNKEIIILSDDEEDETDFEQCPLCSAYYSKDSLKAHIEKCVQHLHDSFVELGDEEVMITPEEESKDDGHIPCPVCGMRVEKELINQHLDRCLL